MEAVCEILCSSGDLCKLYRTIQKIVEIKGYKAVPSLRSHCSPNYSKSRMKLSKEPRIGKIGFQSMKL